MRPYRPADTAFVLCEMQPEILPFSRTNVEATLRRSAALLSDVARTLSIPVFAPAVRLAPDAPPELVAEMAGHRPWVRSVVGALDDAGLAREILATGRRLLALGGVSSEIAILHTALGARRAGYDVHVLVDACGGLSERTERSAFDQMRAAGAVLTNVSSFLTSIVPDMGSDEGRSVMATIAKLWGW